MSLISLSSADNNNITSQQAFNFRNSFAQPLIIKPHSQVALVNFYHFRNERSHYNISNDNNRIVFNFDNPTTNGRYSAFLVPGTYNGGDLATEIARALNQANVAFQNFAFACTHAPGNPNASPPVNDVFEITFTSTATPALAPGTLTNFIDNNTTIALGAAPTNTFTPTTVNYADIHHVQYENGIHNHEGEWRIEDYDSMGGTNNNFLLEAGAAGERYEYTFSPIGSITCIGLYAEDLCSLSPTAPKPFNRFDASIMVHLRRTSMKIKTFNRTTRRNDTKRDLDLTQNGALHTALSNFLFTNADRWKDISYRFRFLKDGVANVAIQLQVSGDGGLVYQPPTEADNTGGTFGVNVDGSPNIYAQQTINGNNVNGIIYMSKQNGNPLAAGGNNNALDRSNILAKVRGKYRCIASGAPNVRPNLSGADQGLSRFDMDGKTYDVDYGAGGSKFNLAITPSGANGYDYLLTANTQAGVPVVNQLVATDFANHALAVALAKDNNGLVFNIHSNFAVAGSPIVGELHFDRRAVNNSVRGNISLRAFTGALLNKISIFDIAVPAAGGLGSCIRARALVAQPIFTAVIENQSNLRRQLNATTLAEPHHHIANHLDFEDQAELVGTLVGATLSSRLVMLLDKITQNDVNTVPGAGGSPLLITTASIAGTIGKLIGFSANVVFMAAGANNQPAGVGNPFLSDAATQVISKETTIHVSIPELSGVKSHEGESSQQYKTIKVIPKSDFTQSPNGSLSFTSNYPDYIDINNAGELQLNELTIQVREPDGKMANTLLPITRCTIKIQQDPQAVETDKMTKIMDRLERVMSSNQKGITGVPTPQKNYT